MEERNVQTREIDLKQLIILSLLRWQVIIAIGLIAALLVGGLAYRREVRRSVPQAPAKLTEAQLDEIARARESYDNAMLKYEQQKKTNAYLRDLYSHRIEWLELQLEAQNHYMEEAAVMRLDPANVKYAFANIFVIREETPTLEEALGSASVENVQLMRRYVNTLQKLDYADAYCSKYQISPENLRDLLSIGVNESGMYLSISMSGSDEAAAKEAVLMVVEKAEELQPEFSSILPHHLSRNDISVYTTHNKSFLDTQNSIYNTRLGLENSIASAQNSLASITEPTEPVIPDELKEEMKASSAAPARGISRRRILKYAILGMAAGIILGAFCVMAWIILSGSVMSADELNRRYRLRGITVLPGAGKNKRSALEKLLLRFGADDAYERMSEEERFALAGSNISAYAGDADSVVLTGSVGSAALEKLKEQLLARIGGKQILCAPHPMRSAESMNTIREHDAVVLVEAAGNSRYSEIDRELEQLKNWGKMPIGSIVI